MKLNIYTKVDVALTNGEREDLKKAQKIIENIIHEMNDNRCTYANCRDYDIDYEYTLEDLNNLNCVITNLDNLTEFY